MWAVLVMGEVCGSGGVPQAEAFPGRPFWGKGAPLEGHLGTPAPSLTDCLGPGSDLEATPGEVSPHAT